MTRGAGPAFGRFSDRLAGSGRGNPNKDFRFRDFQLAPRKKHALPDVVASRYWSSAIHNQLMRTLHDFKRYFSTKLTAFQAPALSRPRNGAHRRDRDPDQMPATMAMLLRVKHSKVAPPLLGLPCRCGWHGVLLASLQQDAKRLGAYSFFSRSRFGYPSVSFMSGFSWNFVLTHTQIWGTRV